MIRKFTHVKKGYDPEEVDLVFRELDDIIDEYRENDEAIKNAIISAQIAADNIIRNAEIEANKMKSRASFLLNGINESVEAQKTYVKSFHDEYNVLVNKYVHQFNDSEITKVYAKLEELEQYIKKLQDTSDKEEKDLKDNVTEAQTV